MRLIFLFIPFFFICCTSPTKQTSKRLSKSFDKDTRYAVEDAPDGFTVSMLYSRYQFIPESDAVLATAKHNLTAICYDVADSKGRAIEKVNDQRIKLSMGRNGLSGITSCAGSVKANYK